MFYAGYIDFFQKTRSRNVLIRFWNKIYFILNFIFFLSSSYRRSDEACIMRPKQELINKGDEKMNKIQKEILQDIAEREDLKEDDITVKHENVMDSVQRVKEWAESIPGEDEKTSEEIYEMSFEEFDRKYTWEDFDRWTADYEYYSKHKGQLYIYNPDEKLLIFAE